MTTCGPFTAITDALERAARNGTRAHLNHDLVRALIASEAYSLLLDDRKKELISAWQEHDGNPPRPVEPSSGRSGSGIGPTATTGEYAGTMTAEVREAVGHAASQRALEAVNRIGRHKRRKTP